MVMQVKNGLLALGLVTLAAACNNNEFNGKNDVAALPPKVSDVAVPCEQGNDKLEKDVEVIANKSGGIVNIKGSFCKVLNDQIAVQGPHINFIIDYSGSMNQIDPLVGGSCKRLEAARALSDSLESKFKDNYDKVEFSLLQFSSQAGMLVNGVVDGKTFKAQYLNSNVFCTSVNGATNYQAAFEMARAQVFASMNGEREKHVFMFTDGVPTLGMVNGMIVGCDQDSLDDKRCRDAGQAAAEALRAEVAGLNLNVLFLTDAANTSEAANRAYLEQVTGNPDNIKFAKDAKDAAAMVTEFKQPEVKTYSSAEAKAKVAGAKVNKDYEIELKKAGEGVWEYELSFDVPPEDGEYTFDIVPTFDGEDLGVATVVHVNVTLGK